MQAPGRPGGLPARRRVGALAALTAVAVLLHAALLSEVRWGWPAPPVAFAALQVRALVAPPSTGAEVRPEPQMRPPVADVRIAGETTKPALDGGPEDRAALPRGEDRPERRADSTGVAVLAPAAAPQGRPSRQANRDAAKALGVAKGPAVASPPVRESRHAAATRDTPQAEGGAVRAAADSGGEAAIAAAASVGVDVRAAETPAPELAASPAHRPADAESAADPIPLYRTRVPPPATLRYALRLAGAAGTAEIRWRPDGEAYGLRLEGRVEGGPTLTQASDGGFDAAGLAPVRHTDARTRRGMLATNFQRDAGRISFSGSRAQVALARGSQDRLSWMVQLAAVLAAEPALRQPGAVVSIPVAGLRGEAAVWRFRTVDSDATADLPVGPPLVRLVRERQGPYDVDIEVALDPARHFLPATLSLRTANGVTALDLALQEAAFER